jgi:carbonic anhydrase/acetyltransferase-like protein (isoleucine patch superfamily)
MKQFLMPAESPQIHGSAFIAPGAVVVGAVTIGEEASIWYQCVLRGDINRIHIGARSNIQDGTVIHLSDDYPAVVGANVSVGHRAIIHACEIGDETLVGMGAIVMDGAVIGPRCVIAAGALVTKGFRAPEGSLIMGSPAKIVRELTAKERQANAALAAKYVEVARRFREMPEAEIRPR